MAIWNRRRSVIIRTNEVGGLTAVHVHGKVEVIVVEDQPVKRSWLKEGSTEFHGGPDDNRPIVLQKPVPPLWVLLDQWAEMQRQYGGK